jgi:outer membrane biosynthesis protein TonB
MRQTPEARSRDIGAALTLALHLVLAAGLFTAWSGARTVELIPPKGGQVLHLRVGRAMPAPKAARPATPPATPPESTPETAPATPPVAQPEQKPKPEPKPTPTPESTPEPAPKPLPKPMPEAAEPLADSEVPPEVLSETPSETQSETIAAPSPQPNAQPGEAHGEEREAALAERLVAALRRRVEAAKSYPFAARKAGITGVVLVRVDIDPSGRVAGYSLAQGQDAHPRLLGGAGETMERVLGADLYADLHSERSAAPRALRLSGTLLVELPIVYELH